MALSSVERETINDAKVLGGCLSRAAVGKPALGHDPLSLFTIGVMIYGAAS